MEDQRTDNNPLAHLKKENEQLDVKRVRRALDTEEVKRLLTATLKAKPHSNMTGYQRYIVYRIAIEEGLRANKIRTLKVANFDFKANTITVEAANSKHRRVDILPMKPDLAELLKDEFKNKTPLANAFPIPTKPVKMIKADLKEAGIPDTDEVGRVVDFHSLRHTFSTLLAASGVHPKVAQELMRHGDINLTMSRYTHVLRGQTQEALEAMPDLSPESCSHEARATGTDNQDVTSDSAYKPAYKKH